MPNTSSTEQYTPPKFTIAEVVEALHLDSKNRPPARPEYSAPHHLPILNFLATASAAELRTAQAVALDNLVEAKRAVPTTNWRERLQRAIAKVTETKDGVLLSSLVFWSSMPFLIGRLILAHETPGHSMIPGEKLLAGAPPEIVIATMGYCAFMVVSLKYGHLTGTEYRNRLAKAQAAHDALQLSYAWRTGHDDVHRWGRRSHAWHQHVTDTLKRSMTRADSEILRVLNELDGEDAGLRAYLAREAGKGQRSSVDFKQYLHANSEECFEVLSEATEDKLSAMYGEALEATSKEERRDSWYERLLGKTRKAAGVCATAAFFAAGYSMYTLNPVPWFAWALMALPLAFELPMVLAEMFTPRSLTQKIYRQWAIRRALAPLEDRKVLELAEWMSKSETVREWIAHALRTPGRILRDGDYYVALDIIWSEKQLKQTMPSPSN